MEHYYDQGAACSLDIARKAKRYKKAKTMRVFLFFLLVWLHVIPFSPLLILLVVCGKWGFNVLISLDQLFNAVYGPLLNKLLGAKYRFGFPDETVSSVVGKNLQTAPHFVIIDKWLSFFLRDPNHSEDAIEKNEGDPFIKQKVND